MQDLILFLVFDSVVGLFFLYAPIRHQVCWVFVDLKFLFNHSAKNDFSMSSWVYYTILVHYWPFICCNTNQIHRDVHISPWSLHLSHISSFHARFLHEWNHRMHANENDSVNVKLKCCAFLCVFQTELRFVPLSLSGELLSRWSLFLIDIWQWRAQETLSMFMGKWVLCSGRQC